MSKSTRQTLVALAVVRGCMTTLMQNNAFARVDIKDLVSHIRDRTGDIIYHWPCTGDEVKNFAWIKSKIMAWDAYMIADKDRYGTAVLCKVCDRLLTDQVEIIKNPLNNKIVTDLLFQCQVLDKFSDPRGQNFPAFEKAGQIIDELYRLIEWEYKQPKRHRTMPCVKNIKKDIVKHSPTAQAG